MREGDLSGEEDQLPDFNVDEVPSRNKIIEVKKINQKRKEI
jgi:hypothetical protein